MKGTNSTPQKANKSYILLITLFILIFGYISSFGQRDLLQNVNLPSPNASAMAVYGEVPVSLSNGIANIDIPVYTLNEGALTVPIALKYHSNGVKPDVHPGWVGNGWILQAGGMITRNVKGREDELRYRVGGYTPTHFIESGHLFSWQGNILSNSNWASSSSMNNLAASISHTGTWIDFEPDVYSFDVAGMSGKFYFGHDGEWHVESNPGVKIEHYLAYNDPGPQSSPYENELFGTMSESFDNNTLWKQVTHLLAGFKITNVDGVQYIFGNYNEEHGSFNACEWSYDPFKKCEVPNQAAHIRMDSWYISKIINPFTQDTIDFQYEKRDSVMTTYRTIGLSRERSNNTVWNWPDFGLKPGYGARISYPSYLKQINTKKIQVDFTVSPSIELKDDYIEFETRGHHSNLAIRALNQGETLSDIFTWYQLDKIEIKHKNALNYHNKCSFTYTHDPSKRLNLLSFQNEFENPYVFDYNFSNPLPAYLKTPTDHWGYHNGFHPRFLEDVYSSLAWNNLNFSTNDLNNYWTIREPSALYMDAEILEKITYPLGGTVSFEYEPLFYSHVIQRDNHGDFSVVNMNQIQNNRHSLGYAGGLRVKTITKDPIVGEIMTKNIEYGKGILNGELKYYNNNFQIDPNSVLFFQRFKTQSFIPSSYGNGNHVTYSKVSEIQSGNGRIEHYFANHDTNLDNNLTNTNLPEISIHEPFENMSLKRGKLIKQEIYNEQNELLKRITYDYDKVNLNNNQLTKLRAIKRYLGEVGQISISGTTQINFKVSTAYEIPIYPYSLTNKTIENFYKTSTGQWKSIIRKSDFEYDSEYAQKIGVSTLNSDGTKYISKTLYSGNINTNAPTTSESIAIQSIKDNFNAISVPIETSKFIKKPNGTEQLIEANYNEFKLFSSIPRLSKNWHTELAIPTISFVPVHTSSGALIKSNLYKYQGQDLPNSEITEYDSNGNILEVKNTFQQPTSLFWNKEKKQLVAKVINSSRNGSAYTNFDYSTNIINQNGWLCNGLLSQEGAGFLGSKCFLFAWGLGYIKKTNFPLGKYMLEYRQKNGTVDVSINGSNVSSTSSNTGQFDLYTVEIEISNNVNTLRITGDNGSSIDNLRIYPKDAQITTFNYDINSHLLLSKGDQNNRFTHYEYDAQQRLIAIKNQNKDIVKSFSYHMKNGTTDNFIEENVIRTDGIKQPSLLSNSLLWKEILFNTSNMTYREEQPNPTCLFLGNLTEETLDQTPKLFKTYLMAIFKMHMPIMKQLWIALP